MHLHPRRGQPFECGRVAASGVYAPLGQPVRRGQSRARQDQPVEESPGFAPISSPAGPEQDDVARIDNHSRFEFRLFEMFRQNFKSSFQGFIAEQGGDIEQDAAPDHRRDAIHRVNGDAGRLALNLCGQCAAMQQTVQREVAEGIDMRPHMCPESDEFGGRRSSSFKDHIAVEFRHGAGKWRVSRPVGHARETGLGQVNDPCPHEPPQQILHSRPPARNRTRCPA